jgi:hypothetical protein
MSIPPRTPDNRTRPIPPTTVFDTPHTRTSHSTSSGILSAVHHQSTVESYLRDELSGSIQKDNTTFFDRLTDHVNSNKALTDCIHAASMESHAWPREKLGEREYYRPWASMLNKFVTTFRTHFANTSPLTTIRDIHFYRYDRSLQHKQYEVKLKPDVLGLPPPLLEEEDVFRAAWGDVIIPGEAKFEDFVRLIHQTASYVRAIYSHQPDRLWVYAIMLTRHNTMIFARYDRSGLIMSPEYDVLRQVGRLNIAKGLCALMTMSDMQFGIDRTISGNEIVVGNVIFYIVETLCYRECVRGRGTRVYVLEPKVHGSQHTIPTMSTTETNVAITSPPVLRRSLRLKRKEDEKVKVVANVQTVCCLFHLRHFFQPPQQDTVRFEQGKVPPKTHPLPNVVMEGKSCILKEAWGVKGFDREGDVISSFQRYGDRRIFGVPSYGPRYVVMADTNTPYSTDLSTSDDTEVRELVRQIIWTKGRKLSEAKGPKELFTALLHAIKGMSECFGLPILIPSPRATNCLQARVRTP